MEEGEGQLADCISEQIAASEVPEDGDGRFHGVTVGPWVRGACRKHVGRCGGGGCRTWTWKCCGGVTSGPGGGGYVGNLWAFVVAGGARLGRGSVVMA